MLLQIAFLPSLADVPFGAAGWLGDFSGGVGVVVGAFLGAYLAYLFSRWQRAQEGASKQGALLEHLRKELSLLSRETEPVDPDALDLRVPIRVAVIPRLLDGELLEHRRYATLIDHLIVLEQLIGRYNDWIHLTNEAQTLGNRPRTEIYQMRQRAEQLAAVIVDVRDTILPLLDVSEQELRRRRALLEHALASKGRGARQTANTTKAAAQSPAEDAQTVSS